MGRLPSSCQREILEGCEIFFWYDILIIKTISRSLKYKIGPGSTIAAYCASVKNIIKASNSGKDLRYPDGVPDMTVWEVFSCFYIKSLTKGPSKSHLSSNLFRKWWLGSCFRVYQIKGKWVHWWWHGGNNHWWQICWMFLIFCLVPDN